MNIYSTRFQLSIIFSCLLLAIIVFAPIGKTGADSSAPEIKIDTFPQSVLFEIDHFKPGDWAPRVLTVQNNGNQDFSYDLTSRLKSGSEKLYKQLDVKIEDDQGILYEGNLNNFTKLPPRKLAKFTQEKLTITVEFPYESGNEFQGLETVVAFTLVAEGDAPVHPPADGDGKTPNQGSQPNTGTLPKTGEEDPLLLIVTGFFITAAGLILLLSKKSILHSLFRRR
ncbi:LPXTG cell wall anchor domain-containing protein [Fictibacillus iocasae]|uniref:LPXTG cell wall anchor domain-containing protein n=1 Tax=Fictibacillus iocasae TaxID=2715437 RepID=A0ABW2NPI0_9BACL